MESPVERALRTVRDRLLREPVSPRVNTPRDIDLHYCRYVAETVRDMLPDDGDAEVVEDGGCGFVHVWLLADGRHYDAECIHGVADYRQLPFFRRHPEAVINLESGDTDPSWVRNRGGQPLYPDL